MSPEDGIVSVGAWFRNEGPAPGVALSLEFDPAQGRRFALWCERGVEFMEKLGRPDLALAWLEGVRGDRTLSRRKAETVVAMIHWLERRGHIKSDEFNGVQWIGSAAATSSSSDTISRPSTT